MAQHDVQFSFEDNSVQVKSAISNAIEAALLEAAAEIVSETARNTRVDTGKTKGSWAGDVNKTSEGYEAVIGSPDQNAIWEEFGTGEYASTEHGGKGSTKKGYWVYVKGRGGNNTSSTNGKSYSLEKAKQIVAIMRSKGLDAYYTKGKRPTFAFWKAFEKVKPKIEKYFQDKFGARFK